MRFFNTTATVLSFFLLTMSYTASGYADEESLRVAKSNSVIELTDQNAKETISSGIVFVDFYAPWCGPCRRFAPIYEEFAEELGNRATAYKVNVDVAKRFASSNKVRSIPQIVVYKDGVEFERKVGSATKIKLIEMLENAER